MNGCKEGISSLWLNIMQGVGAIPNRSERDAKLIAQDKIETALNNMKTRSLELANQTLALAMSAKKALQSGEKRNAHAYIIRRRRAIQQKDKVDNMILSLEQQVDAIENSELNNAVLKAFKDSSTAFTSWHSKTPVKDASEADTIRQELEDHLITAQEITDAASAPLNLGNVDLSELDDEEMLRELDDFEPMNKT
eukprot:2485845-Rhodomonas_salina.1